jgi:hypothetical protein
MENKGEMKMEAVIFEGVISISPLNNGYFSRFYYAYDPELNILHLRDKEDYGGNESYQYNPFKKSTTVCF